jgi:tetratricopeptide (TPR) repeat protein
MRTGMFRLQRGWPQTHARPRADLHLPKRSRWASFTKTVLKEITLQRFVLGVLFLPVIVYILREIKPPTLIIDPFNVPKQFQEAGVTPTVMANRVKDKMDAMDTESKAKKDMATSLDDQDPTRDIEIPGTGLSLKTLIDTTRSLFGIHLTHISGDIAFPAVAQTPDKSITEKSQVTVTIYVIEKGSRSRAGSFSADPADMDKLAQGAAELALARVLPFTYGVYLEANGQYEKAAQVAQGLIWGPSAVHFSKSKEKLYRKAAFNLWGNALRDENKYEEAIVRYQQSIDIDPKFALPYNNWGILLRREGKRDEAIAMYKKATECDPSYALPYNNWGNVLLDKRDYPDAIVKYQKATVLEPNAAPPYNGWGNVLLEEKQYNEAIEKFQIATSLDQNYAPPYINWGDALAAQGKYDEAIGKYERATEFNNPQLADAYTGWGKALVAQGKTDEAKEKFKKADELSRAQKP